VIVGARVLSAVTFHFKKCVPGIFGVAANLSAVRGQADRFHLAAYAQQPPLREIGYLSARTPEDSVGLLADLRRGFAETGFVRRYPIVIAATMRPSDRRPTIVRRRAIKAVGNMLLAGG
jgi:hypothetical protein